MAVAICAFNSLELEDEELMKDGLNVFVKWELSNTFSDLLLRREMVQEYAELDQIGKIAQVDVEPIYAMSFYWDDAAIAERLSTLSTETERTQQLAIIQATNERLTGNLDPISQTIDALEKALAGIDNPGALFVHANDGFLDHLSYFSETGKNYKDNFFDDLKKIKEFLAFAKSLDGDTTYFKFKSGF
jgi:hypothetical protein